MSDTAVSRPPFAGMFYNPIESEFDVNPMTNISGSSDTATTDNTAIAQTISDYTFMDGSETKNPDGSITSKKLPPPLDAQGEPINLDKVKLSEITPALFSQFHSAHQLQLLRANGGKLALVSDDARLDVIMGSDGRTVLVLQEIDKSDLAGLSVADQGKINDYLAGSSVPEAEAPAASVPDTVKSELASKWGVTIGDTVKNNRTNMENLVDDAKDAIDATKSNNREIYKQELDLLKSQIEKSVLFSQTSIQAEIDAIKKRFDTMFAFEKVIPKTTTASVTSSDAADAIVSSTAALAADASLPPEGLNSLDGDALMIQGLNDLLNQELTFLNAKQQKISISTSTDPSLDVPFLVASLQTTDSIESKVESEFLTTIVRQQNALIGNYAVLQSLINKALQAFPDDSSSNTAKLDILGGKGLKFTLPLVEKPPISQEQVNVLIMFDSILSGTAKKTGHPLENLQSITRPTDSLLTKNSDGSYTLVPKTQADWNIFATRLSDAVTLLNQNNQIGTNDISTTQQERNQHSDLSANAARTSADMIKLIGQIS